MVTIQMKRIYEDVADGDGFRVLADRLWPRGVKKDGAKIDLWAKDITPSTALREDYHGGRISWPEFYDRYHSELKGNPALNVFMQTILDKKTVTLLFAGRDTEHCHVQVIMDIIAEAQRYGGKNGDQ